MRPDARPWLNAVRCPGPLRGLRVLDLADQSGALAGKLLAGLGADVVLVEPPGGSPLRAIPPFWGGAPDGERSLFFWFYAAGKRSLTADLHRGCGGGSVRGRKVRLRREEMHRMYASCAPR